MADLSLPIYYRSQPINDADMVGGIIVGTMVDQIDYSEVDVRQFTEPLALAQGLDVGGVWLGARHVKMAGTCYDTTRANTGARIEALESLFDPVAPFIESPNTFGFAPLSFQRLSGAAVVIYVRSNGLRVAYNRDFHGGLSADSLAIQWSVTMIAKDPVIEVGG